MAKLPDKLKIVPKTPGVYFLKNSKGKIIYIGKANNLKNRIKSYFQPYAGYSGLRANLHEEIADIDWKETDSEIEALLLESQLIKKHKPKYNIMLRDDKNYFFVGITHEDFPRVFVTHQTENVKCQMSNVKCGYIGPFTDGGSLKRVLRILRQIFPYYTTRRHPKIECTYCHLGLCPGPEPDIKEYKRNIRAIKEILEGKRSGLIKKLEKEMKAEVKKQNFEKAAEIRDKISALENIFRHTQIISFEEKHKILPAGHLLIFDDRQILANKEWGKLVKDFKKYLGIKLPAKKIIRIEGYDVSNIQGKYATGSMVVFNNHTRINTNLNANNYEYFKPNKDEYRRFGIKTVKGSNDVAMIKEVLRRRFRHPEWPMPDLILVDGGRTQLNATSQTIDNLHLTFDIKVLALAKQKEEVYVPGKLKPIRLAKNNPLRLLLMRIRDEAHRFAISYHKQLRKKRVHGLIKGGFEGRIK